MGLCTQGTGAIPIGFEAKVEFDRAVVPTAEKALGEGLPCLGIA